MDYSFKIEQFEGPLDLLLHLIKKSKIDIEDIFVSEITEQYLEYIGAFENMDMEKSSDFLNMAATLVYIKSRKLVPVHVEDEEDEIDPEVELINRLKLYKVFKETSVKMRDYEKEAAGKYYKLPLEYPFEIDDFSIEGATIDKLTNAYNKVLERANKRLTSPEYIEVAFEKEPVTVKQRKKYIREILNEKGKISFEMLFEDIASRIEIAVTFLALLELLHIGYLMAKQKANLDMIIVSKV